MADTKANPTKPTLEELTIEIGKFNSLLQDPHPGLMSWHMWLEERATRTKEMLEQLGY
jgi:hypothetical protein